MCGRYSRTSDRETVMDYFGVEGEDAPDFFPSYNVAPQTFQPVVRLSDEGRRDLKLMRWGLVPFWAKDAKAAYSTFNARAEEITGKPTFREAVKRRRCLVPADTFYEWVRPESRPDDCPARSRDRTCRPIGSTPGGQAEWQRSVEKPSDNVAAAARLADEPRGESAPASIDAGRS